MKKKTKLLLISTLALATVAFAGCGNIKDKIDGLFDKDKDKHTHTVVIDEGIAATCGATGLMEGSHCSDCGEVFVAQEEIPATGAHILVTIEGKEATCTETGLTESVYCSACSEVLVAEEEIPKSDHLIVQLPFIDNPTCTTSGMDGGSKCLHCGEVLSEPKMIPATGHTLVVDMAVAPTCALRGLTEGSHCSVCEEVLIVQEEIPATEHNYIDGVCTFCDKEQLPTLMLSATDISSSASYGWRSWENVATTGESISGYAFTLKKSDSIQMNGGKGGDYIYNTTALPGNVVSITLTKASGTDRNFDVLTSDTPFDHNTITLLKEQATTAKKVTADGVTWEFDTAHRYFAIVLTDSSAAYLSSIEINYDVCQDEHTVVADEAIAATCGTTGLTEGSHCSVCGIIFVSQEEIPMLPYHDEIIILVDGGRECATCGEKL